MSISLPLLLDLAKTAGLDSSTPIAFPAIVEAVRRIAVALDRLDTVALTQSYQDGVELRYTRPSARCGGDDVSHYLRFSWDEILGLPDHEVAELALIRWDAAETEARHAEDAQRRTQEKRDKLARKRKVARKSKVSEVKEMVEYMRLKAKFEKVK